MSNTLINGTLVKLEALQQTLALSTYRRGDSHSKRFLVAKDSFENWLETGCEGTFYDKDIGNFLASYEASEEIRFTLTWLNGSSERLHGHEEHVLIPKLILKEALREGSEIQYLSTNTPQRFPRLDFSSAIGSLRSAVADPLKRRALSKALRDSFRWNGVEQIRFYNDFRDSFGFQEIGNGGTVGGLILHESEVRLRKGAYPYLYYGVHT